MQLDIITQQMPAINQNIAIQNREGQINIYESNPREDKGNNHIPPNHRIGQPKSIARFTPQPDHESMRANLETPPQQCPSIPTVILLPHTYSTVLITARKFGFHKTPLASHSIYSAHNSKRIQKSFPGILGSVLPPHICNLSIFAQVFSLLWGFSQLFLIPDFQVLPVAKYMICNL